MDRPNPANVKVVCLGLSRTGTMSMSKALAILGLGPCYHTLAMAMEGKNILPEWCKIGDNLARAEDLDAALRGYTSALDCPVAMYPAQMYAAYPNAKFILERLPFQCITTRDPAEWERSMRSTFLPVIMAFRKNDNKSPDEVSSSIWFEDHFLTKFHRVFSDPQQELLDHNERVKNIIPPEKLLVYQVGEGWDRLVDFLGVSKPETPFPHVNDTAQHKAMLKDMGVEKA